MKRLEWAISLLTLAAILSFPPVLAQDGGEAKPASPAKEDAGKAAKAPKGPKMNEAAKAVCEGYEKLLYNLGGAGVKKAQVDIDAKLVMGKGEMARTVESKGKYGWDGKKGSLTWDDTMVAQLLGMQGWSEDDFDAFFDPGYWRKEFDGCTLTGERQEDGSTVVRIEGHGKGGMSITRTKFDEAGLMTGMTLQATGAPVPFEFTLEYEPVGTKFVLAGWSFSETIENVGTISDETNIVWEKHGEFHVPAKVTGTTQMGTPMAKTLVLTWKVNDEVK